MIKFILGLVVGIFVGAFAVSHNPNLADGARVALARLTALVATGAEKAAESVERGAGELADQVDGAGPGDQPDPAPR